MGSDHTPEGTPGTDAGDGEPAAPRQQRRRSTLVAAAVAGAVLLAGGGGAYLAANTGGDGASKAGGEPPPLALDGYPAADEGRAVAPGEHDPSGTGPRFQVKGTLPKGPDKAPVYRTSGPISKEAVARLAKALDLSGTPTLEGGVWRVGGGARSAAPSLQVNQKAPGDWTFSRQGWVVGCKTPPKGTDPSAAECVSRGPDGMPPASDSGESGKPVSEEEATREAKPVLEAAGLGDAKADASLTAGALRIVSAKPEPDGLPTLGWTTSLDIGADGPVSGHGMLADLKPGEKYPVVSARRALDMLESGPVPTYRTEHGKDVVPCVPAQPRGPKASAKPVLPADPERYRPDTDGDTGRTPEDPRILPCVPPDHAKPQEVRKAVFGLSAQSVGGTSALVPSWLFTVAPEGSRDTRVIAQVAVEPKYIRKSTPPASPSDGREPAIPREGKVAVESYSVKGRTLTVHFWGGVCSDYSAKAEESAKKVTVEVTARDRKPGKVCVLIAKKFSEKVQLGKALGDRTVVDATSGEKVRTSG